MTGVLERNDALLLAGGLAAVVGLSINGSVPIFWLAFLLPILALGVAAQLRTPRFLPLAAFTLALAPMPLVIPILLPLGGRSLFVLDVALPAAAIWAARRPGPSRRPDRVVFAYAFVVVVLALVGVLRGAGPSAIIQDLRGPLYLVCGYLIVSRRLGWAERRPVLLTAGAILWWSVAAIALALVTGQELLHGRVGETSAFVGDGKQSLEAVRFLIASKELALVALLGTLGMLLLSVRMAHPRRVVLGLLLPGAFVVFMGFSRQSIVAIVVGLAYLVVVSPERTRTVLRIGAGTLVVGFVLSVLALAGVTARLAADDTVLGRQVSAYSDRVLGGLFGDNVTEDPGNQFRGMENEAAIDYARGSPLVGAGLGMPYRGDLELEAFDEGDEADLEYGRRYVHNVYLWYMVHGGVIGLAAILVLLGRPLVRVLWPAFRSGSRRDGLVLAAGAPYVALLVIGLVEPVIHTNATAPLMGGFLGFMALAEAGQIGGRASRRSVDAPVAVRSP